MYKKGPCTLPVFAQPTNKYWTDQLKPLRRNPAGVRSEREEMEETQGVPNTFFKVQSCPHFTPNILTVVMVVSSFLGVRLWKTRRL